MSSQRKYILQEVLCETKKSDNTCRIEGKKNPKSHSARQEGCVCVELLPMFRLEKCQECQYKGQTNTQREPQVKVRLYAKRGSALSLRYLNVVKNEEYG